MTTTAPSRWDRLIREAIARDAVIDLAPIESQGVGSHIVIRSDADFEANDRPVWRVRLLNINNQSLLVDRPTVAQHPVTVHPGTILQGLLVDGDSRWSFMTRVIEPTRVETSDGHHVSGLRLAWPIDFQTAQRRDFFRVDVAGAELPPVRAIELKDVEAAIAYEKHERLLHRLIGREGETVPAAPPMPETGRAFNGLAIDLSGGGMCLSVGVEAEPLLELLPLLWIRIALPHLPRELHLTARVAHWHRDGDRLLLGLAFCHSRDAEQRAFVADLVCRFTAEQQRLQLSRR